MLRLRNRPKPRLVLSPERHTTRAQVEGELIDALAELLLGDATRTKSQRKARLRLRKREVA